jgi:hypothetical protein
MKLLKTLGLVAWIAFLSVALASAGYWIYSNITPPIQVGGYTLTLNSSFDGTTFHLTGTANVADGQTVSIYRNGTATENEVTHLSIWVADVAVNSQAFSYDWIPPEDGTYRFEARYWA